jgi:predicted DNA binding protein
MIIVEGRIDSPILRAALAAAPGTTVVYEEQYAVDGGIRFFFWAEGHDLDAFDEAMRADPTVEGPTMLAEANDRRLYRVEFTDAGREVATFPTWGEFGLVMLDSRATVDGWRVRVRFPDRDSLGGYLDACRDRDVSFAIEAIFSGSDLVDDVGVRLTPDQREALSTALAVGYFEIPRAATLEDVAERLGISSQATSERLRRGIASLVETTVSREAASNHRPSTP